MPDLATAERRAAAPSDGPTPSRPIVRNRLIAATLVVTALFAAFDALLLPASSIVFSPRNYLETARVAAALAFGFAIGWGTLRHFRRDESRMGLLVRQLADGLRILTLAGGLFALFGLFAGLFMYLASDTSAPLIDGALARADAALGLHWLPLLERVNAAPLVARGLVFAYATTGPVLILLFPLLAFSRREDRLMELVALIAVTSLFTGILMYLFPAAGAYAWFQPAAPLWSNLSAQAGMWHYEVLQELRSGRPFTYLQSQATGLVTFPSFHTVLAIITAYAARGIRGVFPVLLVLNAIVVVSTVPEGGHYVVDVIAGGLVAVVGIVAVRAFAPTR